MVYFIPLITFLQKNTLKTRLARVVSGGHILDSFFIVLSSVILITLFYFKFSEPQVMLFLSFANFLVTSLIFYLFPDGIMEVKNIIKSCLKK